MSYHSHTQQSIVKSFIPCSKENHIQFKMGFRWVLLFSQDLITFKNSFSAERNYECQILLCRILFTFKHGNNLLPLITSKYYLKVFWLIYKHVILYTQKPLCVHVVCTLVTMCTICWALTCQGLLLIFRSTGGVLKNSANFTVKQLCWC